MYLLICIKKKNWFNVNYIVYFVYSLIDKKDLKIRKKRCRNIIK